MLDQLTRRDVVKTLLVTSAYSLINNKLWAAKTVSEVTAAAEPTDGVARIPIASFPALNNNGGAVRLTSSAISSDRARGVLPPVHINRISATEFVALESACTHEGFVVGNFSGSVAAGRMTCPRHNSQFDIRGNRTAGPANGPLLRYETSVANGIIQIRFPFLNFDTTQQVIVSTGGETRIEFSWPSFAFVEYEVRYRANDIAAEGVRVPMSLTKDGPISPLFRTGDINDGIQKCWIRPENGIYQIAIRLRV